MTLRGRWEQGVHLESKVPDCVGRPTLWPLGVDGSKVPISGVRCPITLVVRPYALRGQWEQGAHLGTRRKGPLAVSPDQLVSEVGVDEGFEEGPSSGLVLAYEASKAVNILHPVRRLLLDFLRQSGLAFDSSKLLFQLLDPKARRSHQLLERLDLFLPDIVQSFRPAKEVKINASASDDFSVPKARADEVPLGDSRKRSIKKYTLKGNS
nr:hypothetical protein Iba_chr07bCG9170 [Ipomoea batatas]